VPDGALSRGRSAGGGALRQAQFTAGEQETLTLVIVAINGWNRVQVGFRPAYPAGKQKAA
jgi:hypothetical protein